VDELEALFGAYDAVSLLKAVCVAMRRHEAVRSSRGASSVSD
jgi:hypothetical protein